MDNLLLKSAGVIFLLALAVMMIRMFLTKGSKLKALIYLVVYAFTLYAFSTVFNITQPSNPNPSVEELQAVEMQDYLADSKDSYALGIKALKGKDYLQAIRLLSQVFTGDPKYEDAQAKLAQAKLAYADQLLEQGRDTMMAGDFDQAVELFNESLAYNRDLVEARKLKLDAYTRKQAALQAEAAEKAALDLRHAKLKMGQYVFGADNIGFSVKKTKVTGTIPTSLGFSYVSRGDERFLWVYVSVVNRGKTVVDVNPEYFYISTNDGSRIARSEATNSQAHLPAMTLKPGSTADGWVIFYVPVQRQYSLNYYLAKGEINKVIVP